MLIVAALLLELTTAMQYFSTRTGITRQMVEMAHRDLSESDRTAELKREVELTVAQMLPTLGRLTSQLASDSLHLYIDEILGRQDEIVGFDFCLVKGKNGKPDGIYIYKDDKTGAPTEHHIDFDFTKRSWYQEGIKCDGFWSEPYMSNYKVILMCTYSRPVRDAEGQIVAILGADVPMRDVSSLASTFRRPTTFPLAYRTIARPRASASCLHHRSQCQKHQASASSRSREGTHRQRTVYCKSHPTGDVAQGRPPA